mmetsp:Transcript_13540/g.18577  ORF Transcript_13540/g.18577 Transcript_13540/m.18577 type:complete len:411 (-) Transcript_13540:19-1251(-)
MKKNDNIRSRLQSTESSTNDGTKNYHKSEKVDDEKKDAVPKRTCGVDLAHLTRKVSLCSIFICLLLLHFVAFSFNVLSFHASKQNETLISASKSFSNLESQTATENTVEIPWEKYENCTIQNRPSSPLPNNELASTSTEKPLWAPLFPNSLDDKLLKNLIHQLTGLSTGAKSYYAQRKGLRKCQSETDDDTTVLCIVVHPIIKTNPQDLTSLFNTKVVFFIRNIITAFPVYANYKAIKYHSHPPNTQISVEEWRKLRDLYLETELKNWKEQLYEWKKHMKGLYDVALYVPLEQLMDERRAPNVLQRLIHELKESGFPLAVSSDLDDLSCVWYKSFGREVLEQMHMHGYEYSDYVPGYTQQQKDFLLEEFSVMMEENRDDKDLLAILQEYREYVQRHLSLDQPWSNDTLIK